MCFLIVATSFMMFDIALTSCRSRTTAKHLLGARVFIVALHLKRPLPIRESAYYQ